MKKAQFHAKTPQEHKAIITLLYSYGYKKRSFDANQCHENLQEYSHLVIYADKVIGGNYEWSPEGGELFVIDTSSIGEIIDFLTEEDSVHVPDFGDHVAQVFKDKIFIGGPGATVEFDRVKEIYDIISNKQTLLFDELHITVKNDAERRFLLHALNSFGYKNRYYDNLERWCLEWEEDDYQSIVVYPVKTVGANGRYNSSRDGQEYVFSRDMDELYPLLSGQPKKIVVEDIAGFGVEVKADIVQVGCQSISYDKIKEVYALMVKLQNK